jgi:4-phospho-D-threonate 3-dehydrogenase / 4-phospho-D-erythronate 3-dehydrogenase
MARSKPTIGITLGDPAGIGAEVIAKSLAKPAIRSLAAFKIIGDFSVYRRHLGPRKFFPTASLLI